MYENSRDTTCGETAKFKIKVFLSMLCDRSQAKSHSNTTAQMDLVETSMARLTTNLNNLKGSANV